MKRVVLVVLISLLLSACGEDKASTPKAAEVPAWAKVAPEQIAEAKKHGVPVAFENDLGMRFVLIPAGTFLMGSPEDEKGRNEYGYGPEEWRGDEETQHEVTITQPFYLATTETTQAVWEKVMGRNPSTVKGAALPVMHVLWEECQTFVKRLNGTAPSGYRLPTEAEWEYACRASTTTRFWSGDTDEDLDRVGWYFHNSGNQRLPLDTAWQEANVVGAWACRARAVGGKPANPWGLHDMHGNVWEWCEDYWHDSYEGAPDDGSAWLDQASRRSGSRDCRVLRGGSWYYSAMYARSANRYYGDPGSLNFGFRPARAVTPKEPPGTARVASPQVPDDVLPATSTRPEDVVRLWLGAAKRGDAEAMLALWVEEKRPEMKTSLESRTADVASGKSRPAWWRLGEVGVKGEERTVTVHVDLDNLRFHFVQRDGRWWIVSIWDYD